MSLFDAFRYDGKRALVVGGATGMGAATAELVKDAGAEVVVMDRAEVTLDGVKAITLDLSDKASIGAAVDQCGGPVHALFSCAGVADGTPGIEASKPVEQAYPLVFLCSDAASGIAGITMITDAGYYASGVTGSFAPAQEVIGFLRSV